MNRVLLLVASALAAAHATPSVPFLPQSFSVFEQDQLQIAQVWFLFFISSPGYVAYSVVVVFCARFFHAQGATSTDGSLICCNSNSPAGCKVQTMDEQDYVSPCLASSALFLYFLPLLFIHLLFFVIPLLVIC